MKKKFETIIIAEDDFPLEFFRGRPIVNFFRRLLLGKHKECKQCYEHRKSLKVLKG